MNQDDINAMNPSYRDSMNYSTGGTFEETHGSAQHITDIQKQNGHSTPYAQQPGESWDHYQNRINSW